MGDWKTLLMDLDDDYLVGMANKGIVKRAYKDMEAGDYKVVSADGEAQITVGGETVLIRQPLGESTCTCPSRTICRHVILGILALKDFIAGNTEETTGNIPEKETGKTEEGADGNAGEADKAAAKTEEAVEQKQPEGVAVTLGGTEKQPNDDSQNLKSRLLAEIEAYPLAPLKKILGAKRLNSMMNQIASGYKPEITYSSVITVSMQPGGYTVKLLSPLEYSTCTCHKKEFCTHKAAALLWCKLASGKISSEELREDSEMQEYSMEEIRETARQMKAFLDELLCTGLARTSPDVLDYLDRLAIISHNAKLPNFEGYWRALHDSYENYIGRKASFRVRMLMEQFARLCARTGLLETSADAAQISALAGEFRSEYVPVGNLDLIGIAIEHFESQTGYEGETVYFLEKNTKEWYTYTSARPVFYETSGRRGRQEKAGAPWGLPVSIKELAGLRIHLSGARCDSRGRLSASGDTRGEVTGNCKKENCLHTSELGGWFYRDFGELFERQVAAKQMPWLRDSQDGRRDGELVVLRPYSFTKGEFSETEQKLLMWLYDAAGREVVLELAYSKREEWGIGYLERLTEEKQPYFLGKLYFRDGRMRLYPVAVFEGASGEICEDTEDEKQNCPVEKGAEEKRLARKTEITAQENDTIPADCGSIETGGEAEIENAAGVDEETPMDILGHVLEDAGSLLEELYQSGLDTVHDSTLEGLRNMVKLAGQYGLSHLSGLFQQLADGAAMRRHQLKKENDGLAAVYAEACGYLYLCRGKVEIDQGKHYYKG